MSDRLKTRVPRTFALVILSQVLALLLSIPAGIVAAWRANTWVDRGLSSTSIGLLAIPNYVAGIFFVFLFALQLGWFPSIVSGNVNPSSIGELIQPWSWDFNSFLLPALALSLGQVAVYMRLLRTDMIATLQEDFIGMAKAKGMPTRSILFRHALRPSSLSLVTSVGINAGAAIGGTVIIEAIFGMPGMGQMLVDAIGRGDIMLIFDFADDLVGHFLFRILVHEVDGRAEHHRVAGKFRHVDHVGAGNLVFKLRHTALIEALLLLGGVILGIFTEIAMRAGFGDRLDDARPLHGLQKPDLLFQGLVALGSHWNLFHFS